MNPRLQYKIVDKRIINLLKLTDILNIPIGIIEIGESFSDGFDGESVSSVVFSGTVYTIARCSLMNLDIRHAYLNEILYKIDSLAFAGSMTKVRIPSNTEIIEDGAFTNCRLYELEIATWIRFAK